jgi:hypothetical protein
MEIHQSHSNSQRKPTRAIQTLMESQPEPFNFSLKANQLNSQGSQSKQFKIALKANQSQSNLKQAFQSHSNFNGKPKRIIQPLIEGLSRSALHGESFTIDLPSDEH